MAHVPFYFEAVPSPCLHKPLRVTAISMRGEKIELETQKKL